MKVIKIVFIFFLLFFPVSDAIPETPKGIAVVVNSFFPSERLTLPELKEIYLGYKNFIGGTRLHPYHQQDDRLLKNLFIEDALGISQISYMSFWHVKSFRDGSSPPKSLHSSQDLIDEVRTKPGALGYIWSHEADGADGIRVLITIGVGRA